jgi:DnaJ domain
MPFFLAGLALLLLLIFGGRLFASADPRRLAAALRKLGGVAALAIAALLVARGALPLAIPLAVFGLALIGRPIGRGFGFGWPFSGPSRKAPGQKSHIRTEALEMELDHDSGDMEGQCLQGKFAGRMLSSLGDFELRELLAELRANDMPEAALIEVYLDRRSSGWGEGRSEEAPRQEQRHGRPASSRMSVEEAYAVLELRAGASADDIRRAHRKLMMKMHPDQGGSTYLAARINEAKEVLLGRN